MKQHWVAKAFTSDALVAELLLRIKQSSSSSSYSSHAQASPATEKTTAALLNPIRWGNRRSRSKPSTTATVSVTDGSRKEQRSPSTPLYWGGGGSGAASTSDGSHESSRPADLSADGRSTKVDFSNDYLKSRKRKGFAEIKEEGFLLNEKRHLKRMELQQIPKRETDQFVQVARCKVEPKVETFVLPDLNETPPDEESAMP